MTSPITHEKIIEVLRHLYDWHREPDWAGNRWSVTDWLSRKPDVEFLRDLYQRLQAEKEGTQEQADDVERAFRIARRMYPDAINQVAKVHDRAEGLAKEVERLQRQVESFEADADYHRAQRETIKRHEDQIRDLKVMVSAAEAKLAIYEAPRAAEGPTMHEQSVEIDRLTTEVSALSAAHAECKGENTKRLDAIKAAAAEHERLADDADQRRDWNVADRHRHAAAALRGVADAFDRAALVLASGEKAT